MKKINLMKALRGAEVIASQTKEWDGNEPPIG